MDPVRYLVSLRQGNCTLEAHIQRFLDIAHLSDLPDCALIDFFAYGLNEPLKGYLNVNGPRGTFREFLDFALLTIGSRFTVGVVGKHDTAVNHVMAAAPVDPNKMAATITTSHHVSADRPEQRHASAGRPEQRHSSADRPEQRHVSADRPEQRHVSADRPEQRHVSADRPESRHVSRSVQERRVYLRVGSLWVGALHGRGHQRPPICLWLLTSPGRPNHLTCSGCPSHLTCRGCPSHLTCLGCLNHLTCRGYPWHLTRRGYPWHLTRYGCPWHLNCHGGRVPGTCIGDPVHVCIPVPNAPTPPP
ncbi:hypothetical protein DPX16_2466 [Anabarilius grahami]|uniref:Retrotransposon gag domain-containing protein n=1 Tax=Anabarilius grahami TaxID=495550 RepID=A0A3N0Z5K3_ANAGA|nr:hypothetical protein DPX16_2466 [Anabarilius grahami]